MSPEHRPGSGDAPHVVLESVVKRFHGVQALRDVSLAIQRGTVHALVGENGAGKSTLGKIVAGVLRPDGGRVLVDGRPERFASPRAAVRLGIAIVQQEIALVPQQTVLQNVFLGAPAGRGGLVSTSARRRRFEQLAREIGVEVDPSRRVGELRIPEQQQVELMRALNQDAKLVVLDEPTASLTRSEAANLLRVVRGLRKRGITVIYVSHALEEILELADTITVLRSGALVRSGPAAQESKPSLISAMLGRPLDLIFPSKRPTPPDGPVVARVRGLTRAPVVRDVSFEIRAGEILGLAGIVGSGRSEVARIVAGADRPQAGEIAIGGAPVRFSSPRDAIRAGVVMIPESRKDDGLLLGRSIAENIALPNLGLLSRRGVMQSRRERERVAEMIERLDVRPPVASTQVEHLSGGNQQKVLFGKWLLRTPVLLLADEPTRGVDVGAKAGIYELIAQLAAQGLGVLLISSEIEEVIGLAHRVLVMRRGSVVAELAGDAIGEEAILTAALTGEAAATHTLEGVNP